MTSENIYQRLARQAAKLAEENPRHAHLFSPVRQLTQDGKTKCSIITCQKNHYGQGLCQPHWLRRQKGNLRPDEPVVWPPPMHGSKNPRWKGGEIEDGHGRISVFSPGHPNPTNYGTHVYRYRLVMEAHLGRYLEPWEIVHHKNGIKNDDRIENLEVMTQAQHCGLHAREWWGSHPEYKAGCKCPRCKHKNQNQ